MEEEALGLPWQGSSESRGENRESGTALEILKQRYAGNEMDKEFKLISITRIICSSLCLIYTLTGCRPMFGPRGRMGPGMMGPWGMGWSGGIFVILIVILVIVALIFLLPRIKQNYKIDGVKTLSGKSNALDILKERYARGEIDKTEFEEKKKDLEKS